MTPQEFEQAVRELRRRQRLFFNCRTDNPDKEKALQLMRQQERIVWPVVDAALAQRPANRRAENQSEEFFLLVADMIKKQRQWAHQGGGSWSMYSASEAEKTVDTWLSRFDEEKAAAKRRLIEAEQAKQTSLF